MRAVQVTRRIEQIKELVNGISKDLTSILSMAQMSIPVGEAVIKRVVERVDQIKGVIKKSETEEADGGNG